MTIKDISQLEAGTTVPNLSATVVQAYMPKSGKTKKGRDWKVQSATLSDDTGEIKASFWNLRIDLRDLKDNVISIISPQDEVTATDNEYSGSVHRELNVGEGAKVDEVIGDSEKTSTETSGIKTNSYLTGQDATRLSIERQVALKEAASSLNTASTEDIIHRAEKFYTFLRNGNDKVI